LFDALGQRGHEGARTVALHEHPVLDQLQHRLADGNAGDVDLGGKIAFGRQGVAGVDLAPVDGVLDPALELQVKRAAGRQHYRTIGKETVGEVGHSSTPGCVRIGWLLRSLSKSLLICFALAPIRDAYH
jgi:hypothetical protein